ncbi:hypothetical protein BDZ94DRAFT_375360 [Collybia nuda]|uniref:Uncharacterized protein n=1 Tax=Collybia nuda TaxID=64659 RepID=A0A9P5YG57_9AGAR|nr:hypothetical protein BDZ94DRAFT_375360 [Collybia nuda]
MPFFENTKGTVTINDSTMTDVKGNMHHNDHSKHVTNHGSHNATTHNVTNSHNNSSRVEKGNRNQYYNHMENRQVYAGLNYVNVRGKPTASRSATGLPHSPPARVGGKPAERVQPQNVEQKMPQSPPDRERGSQNHLEEQRRTAYEQNPWRGGNYMPAEDARPAYGNAEYTSQEGYGMNVDPQPEYPSPPRMPSPDRRSRNPFYAAAQQPPKEPSFEEFTSSAWGTK